MKAKEVTNGGRYHAKVSGKVVPVVVLEEIERTDWKGRTRHEWRCRNESTGREITVRSAQRFRAMVAACQVAGCARSADFIATHEGRRIAGTEVCAACQPAALARLNHGMTGWQHVRLCRHSFDLGMRTGRAGKIEGTEIVTQTCSRCGTTREAMMDFELTAGIFTMPAKAEE